MSKVFAELSKDHKTIEVYFPYSPDAVAACKRINGYKFIPRDKGGPYWRFPLDLVTGQRLREEFGGGLVLGDGLKAWGRDEVSKQRNLRSLTRADKADLVRLPKFHPELFKFVSARPYQTADIAMMAATNVLNANQPGTGKTIETIGALVEADIWDRGPHLVIAPVRSLENVWLDELDWLGLDVYTAEDVTERKREVSEGIARAQKGEPVVICVNPDMIRLKKVWDIKKDGVKNIPPPGAYARKDHRGNIYDFGDAISAALVTQEWQSVTIDEFHKHGLGNRNSLFSLSVTMLKARRKYALSGTPIGGKPRKLWAILNWLEPDEYTSEWRWISNWLMVDDNGFGKKVGDIIPGREDAFYEAHARHMVRRLKREALPGLPPQVHIPVTCKMTPAQRKQYDDFARDAEIRIDEERLSATSVLAEYTRLKQFANARQELRDGVPHPTEDSGKLGQLLEKLDEEGIRKLDPEPRARAIIASESSRMVYMVSEFLRKQGVENDTMTGDTKDTRSIIKRFKSDDPTPYVIVMTIQTGGVSLNLEEAGSMHALDETWNPDDMEQFFDRGDRGSRDTPLRCYVYRSENSIQEMIAEITEGKAVTNKNVLDIRRQMYKEDE
jgi:SNF2 family DNA or RNA helicase